jgi:ATP-dependent Clp protease adapter protein ClpS
MTIHLEGAARVGSYTREVANHKVDQTMLFAAIAHEPLQVYVEWIV